MILLGKALRKGLVCVMGILIGVVVLATAIDDTKAGCPAYNPNCEGKKR